jgi:hypothetical protein
VDFPLHLTIEQEFQLKICAEQARSLTAEQAQEMLLELMRQTMIKDNVVRHLIKKTMGC